jgi:hypothetical protein
LQESNRLTEILGSEKDPDAFLLQLTDDWLKKENVWTVADINPYELPRLSLKVTH